ncbi:alpha-amylase family glycosyl hydrolase [Rubripirellula obstinata]|nr:alpha-amylase family glycosyl hydrolase [Rubripirellula obstinata]
MLKPSFAIGLLFLTLIKPSQPLAADLGTQDSQSVERPWNEDVIYFALTDRFHDGDPSNNTPKDCDPALYDLEQSEISMYHGGDFRGIEKAIQSGYFTDLGISAIWLSPPVRNAWRSAFDSGGPKTGYHGYWTQDFLDIDPHLVSSKSLDGTPYPDNRDGRMMHYRDLVNLAHQHGIKVIQDVVCNHTGPLFYYDANENGQLDSADKQEWIAPFAMDRYTNTAWVNQPQWNLLPPQPAGVQTVLGKQVNTTGVLRDFNVYGRFGFNDDSLGKSDGEEVLCDFFSLRDLYTHPEAPHFDALVDEFVEIYYFYINTIGIDGLRLDTVKHVHHEFWTAFTHRLRAKLGDDADKLLISGEVYDGNPRVLGRYTFSKDPESGQKTTEPCLDSLLNFQFCFNLRDYLRKPGADFGNPWGLQNTTDYLYRTGDQACYNEEVGFDGLRPRQKMINFYENHDGLNRFLVKEVDEVKHRLALTILMTSEGIPCVYYGAEASLRDTDGQLGRDSETGRITFAKQADQETLQSAKQAKAFELIRRLVEMRQNHPALTSGSMATLWTDADNDKGDDGLYVFTRFLVNDANEVDRSKTVLVAINANPNKSAMVNSVSLATGNDGQFSLALPGDSFLPFQVVGGGGGGGDQGAGNRVLVRQDSETSMPSITINVPASSAIVYVLQ